MNQKPGKCIKSLLNHWQIANKCKRSFSLRLHQYAAKDTFSVLFNYFEHPGILDCRVKSFAIRFILLTPTTFCLIPMNKVCYWGKLGPHSHQQSAILLELTFPTFISILPPSPPSLKRQLSTDTITGRTTRLRGKIYILDYLKDSWMS